ncbi:Uncharacterised protein [uncultured archaeon]|nr:Uncharacterised protein [uncultured archaeon]
MKKSLVIGLFIFFIIAPFISAINLNIEPASDDVAMIKGSSAPAIFDLRITNNGGSDNLMFYNFFGSDTFPKGTVPIGIGETKNVSIGIYPRTDLKQEGKVIFDLYIKGQDNSQMTYQLTSDVVELNEAFEVGAEEFKPDSNKVSVYIKNLLNFNFENINAQFKSPFFNFEKTFALAPNQKQSFEIALNRNDFRDLMAGFYTLDAAINFDKLKTNVQGTMKFSEKNIVTSSENDYGIIINTNKILKVNEGNVVSESSTVLKKNIISRLFTSFNPEPDSVERKGLSVYYTWNKELKPGEQFSLSVRTNWLLPLLAILLIIAIVILVKQFSKTNLSIRKKVNFVRAKGGEFALKVSVIVTARKYVERIHVIDRLPLLAKLHERFGGEMPKKVDERSKKLEWHFDRLQAGESRILSYIIYSKVGVLGKFSLPTATAVYEKDGEVHEAESNHAFFIADQIKKDRED